MYVFVDWGPLPVAPLMPFRRLTSQNPSSSDALANADAVLMACLWERGQVVDLALKRLPVLPESASKVGAHVTHLYLNGNRLKTLPADFFRFAHRQGIVYVNFCKSAFVGANAHSISNDSIHYL